VDENTDIREDLVQLARVALADSAGDVHMLVRRYARRYRQRDPELAQELTELLRAAPTRSSPLRGVAAPTPVDADSRLDLLRITHAPVTPRPPVLNKTIRSELDQLVQERIHRDVLRSHQLEPARSALLVGPPGVGKTLSATWIAEQLALPLLVLDLSAVMNSLLGKTGTNLRLVLDHAKDIECVLLLDELDAIAKRRDDHAEVGELKRLVTVLLQEIDRWPANALLLGATNHPDLLDPAIWRRFDVEIHFGIPALSERRTLLAQLLEGDSDEPLIEAFAASTEGWSFADLERSVRSARRRAALGGDSVAVELFGSLQMRSGEVPLKSRRAMAVALLQSDLSQRRVSALTGMSRDTLRKLSRREDAS